MTRKLLLTASLLTASLLALPALAGELKGVKMPDTLKVSDAELKLNGMGLRKKAMFKVYVAGLYLAEKQKDPSKIIAADAPRAVRMHLMRDLEKSKITEAIIEGFKNNSSADLPKLQDRLDKFNAVIPDLKENDELDITYTPGKGTRVKSGDKEYVAPGKDFADALFLVWLGKKPADEDLKEGMLGN